MPHLTSFGEEKRETAEKGHLGILEKHFLFIKISGIPPWNKTVEYSRSTKKHEILSSENQWRHPHMGEKQGSPGFSAKAAGSLAQRPPMGKFKG